MSSSYKSYRPWRFSFPKYGRNQAIGELIELEKCVVMDCETTNIGKRGEICELSMVEYPSRKVLINTLLKPVDLDGYESSKAREIHGIPLEELEQAPTIRDIWSDIECVISSGMTLTAWNAQFDYPMLRRSAYKWGIQASRIDTICLMRLFTTLYELEDWLSVEECARYYGIDQGKYGQAHRSLADCYTEYEILDNMLKEIDK